MKKVLKVILILVLCLSLSGCASVQASIAMSIQELYGIKGRTYEEYEAMYQAEWDEFYESLSQLLGIAKDEVEKLVKDMIEDAIQKIFYGDSVDWESIKEEDKVTLANIKDENGYTDHYNNKFSKGQCTWYAFGRFEELTDLEDLEVSGNAKTWLDNCNDDRVRVERDVTKIEAPAIAVDYKTSDSGHPGHVTVVEHVTYDENGNPVDIYFTESNWDSNGAYNEGKDGIVKILPYNKFINRGDHKVIGFIIPD